MQSNNPVFRRSEEFNGAPTNAYGNQTYPGNGATHQGYGQAARLRPAAGRRAPATTGRPMTIDSVVQKTGISLARRDRLRHRSPGGTSATSASTAADVERTPAPLRRPDDRLARRLRAVDGQLVQAGDQPGAGARVLRARGRGARRAEQVLRRLFSATAIVTQAVIGTFAAFAGTLAAYKFFNIQVGNKFRTFVIAAMFGMVGLGLLEMVLGALRQPARPVRLRRPRPAVRGRRPGARRVHADPRLRLRRAGRRRRHRRSASRGGRRSP